jgi:hypothetical protein
LIVDVRIETLGSLNRFSFSEVMRLLDHVVGGHYLSVLEYLLKDVDVCVVL